MKKSLFVLGGALLSAGFGCRSSAYITPGVEVDRAGDTTTYQDTETDAEVSMSTNASVPSNFPSDVPQYAGAKVTSAIVGSDATSMGAQLAFETSDSVDAVTGWYRATLIADGWTEVGTYNISGQMTSAYQKGAATMAVMVSANAEGTATTGIVTWTPGE